MSELAGGDFELAWPPGNPRKWEFKEWEIDCFLRAYYEHSLFELKARVGPKGDAHIGFVGPLMLPNSQGKPYVHEFLVGWKRERPLARLYSHEYLTQFSAAGELVGIYNQPNDRLVAELALVREIAGQMKTYLSDGALPTAVEFFANQPPIDQRALETMLHDDITKAWWPSGLRLGPS